jgi:hypothetical protein
LLFSTLILLLPESHISTTLLTESRDVVCRRVCHITAERTGELVDFFVRFKGLDSKIESLCITSVATPFKDKD